MKKEQIITENKNRNVEVPALGYELLRKELIPQLLGKEHESILYWAGKTIARNHPLQTIDEIIDFFEKVGWGALESQKHKKNELIFELSSHLFSNKELAYSCQLEAGFLAEQIQRQTGLITETYTNQKAMKVTFTVKSDTRDEV